MNESLERKVRIWTESKDGQEAKLILAAARTKERAEVMMLANGTVGTGIGLPNLSVDQDIMSASSKFKGERTIPRKMSQEVNKICKGASTATKIRANSLAASSES